MTLLSSVLPGIKTGSTCIMLTDLSVGTLPVIRTLTVDVAAIGGATTVSIVASANSTTVQPGSIISVFNATSGRRVAIQPTSGSAITLGTVATIVNTLPISDPIATTSAGPWAVGQAPLLGVRSFNIAAAPNNVDLTGTDIQIGVATGRTRIGVTADVEFVERPLNAPTSILKRAFYGSSDNTANLWTAFQREDGELMYGMALWALNSSTNGYNSYAMHTATCSFQGNTYVRLPVV